MADPAAPVLPSLQGLRWDAQLREADVAWHAPRRRYRLLAVAADLVAGAAAIAVGLAGLALTSNATANSLSRLEGNATLLGIFLPALLLAFVTYGLYRRPLRQLRPSTFHEIKDLSHAIFAAGFLTLGLGVALHSILKLSEERAAPLAAVTLAALLLVPLARAGARRLVTALPGGRVRVVLFGTGPVTDRLRRHLERSPGVEVLGLVDDCPAPGVQVLGGASDLLGICQRMRVDRVLVYPPDHPRAETVDLLRRVQAHVPISVVPGLHEILSWRSMVEDVGGLPIVDVAPPELGMAAQAAKRGFDIAGALVGLALMAPLLAVAAIAVKLSSPGPVFFRQVRSGRDGQPFRIFKLRTMLAGTDTLRLELAPPDESAPALFKLVEDPRVTGVGRLLRRTSIDELPQLLNVLAGHMSLVGPRPFVVDEANRLEGWAARRFDVRPGLTGLWQVSGRSDLEFDELRSLDYIYVASWSLWWDLKILLQTPGVVMRHTGAY